MKKIITILLIAVMSLTILVGCGNSAYDDFENFLNKDMVSINANYDAIKAESARWGDDIEENADIEASLVDVLLPLVNDSLDKLNDINPTTDDVKQIKEKYVSVMQAYKDGFEKILEGIRENDSDKVLEGGEKLENGTVLLDDYNAALEELAAQFGAEIEY